MTLAATIDAATYNTIDDDLRDRVADYLADKIKLDASQDDEATEPMRKVVAAAFRDSGARGSRQTADLVRMVVSRLLRDGWRLV